MRFGGRIAQRGEREKGGFTDAGDVLLGKVGGNEIEGRARGAILIGNKWEG